MPRTDERRTIPEETFHAPRKNCREKIAIAGSWDYQQRRGFQQRARPPSLREETDGRPS